MANKQHIYKGAGKPWEVLPDFYEVEGHHYLDTETGDVYIGGLDGDWIKVNDPVELGIYTKLEVQGAPTTPPTNPPPDGPMLWINQSNGDAYLSVGTGFPSLTWEWRKISFV